MRKKLELYSDVIEETLARHNVRLRVTGGKVHPRFITFQGALDPG